jgi:hypothetical protein
MGEAVVDLVDLDVSRISYNRYENAANGLTTMIFTYAQPGGSIPLRLVIRVGRLNVESDCPTSPCKVLLAPHIGKFVDMARWKGQNTSMFLSLSQLQYDKMSELQTRISELVMKEASKSPLVVSAVGGKETVKRVTFRPFLKERGDDGRVPGLAVAVIKPRPADVPYDPSYTPPETKTLRYIGDGRMQASSPDEIQQGDRVCAKLVFTQLTKGPTGVGMKIRASQILIAEKAKIARSLETEWGDASGQTVQLSDSSSSSAAPPVASASASASASAEESESHDAAGETEYEQVGEVDASCFQDGDEFAAAADQVEAEEVSSSAAAASPAAAPDAPPAPAASVKRAPAPSGSSSKRQRA